jgi:hypothetical protein
MKKIKIWFVYEKVIDNSGRFSKLTREVVNLINGLEKFYDKNTLDLRAIEYERFISEHKNIAVNKKNLPVTLLNKKIFFIKELPSVSRLKKEIKKYK